MGEAIYIAYCYYCKKMTHHREGDNMCLDCGRYS